MPGVAVVSVPVTDQDRAAAFYTEHLGFRVIDDSPMGPGMRWLQLAAGEAPTTLTLTTWFDTMPAGSIEGLVIDVPDPTGAGRGSWRPASSAPRWATSPGGGTSPARTPTATGSSSRGRHRGLRAEHRGRATVLSGAPQRAPKTMMAPV